MIYETESRKSFWELDAALREAAARHQFGVLGVIDLKEKMNEKGVDFTTECSVYEVCNPQQAKRVLDANGAVSAALPCRISVYGRDGSYKIATLLPTALINAFGTPGLADVAKEVENDVVSMIKEAA